MDKIIAEIIFVGLLLVANGVFAMTEIALVSSRRVRLKRMAEEGSEGAAVALELAESPSRLLSTVQIGITLIGIFAGAIGGATLAGQLQPAIAEVPYLGAYAHQIAFTLVVVVITYFSLVIGELVPKRLAMQNPEVISAFMAKPMTKLAAVAGPVVHLLAVSTEGILRLMRAKPKEDGGLTEEEVAGMVREGARTGVLYQAESEMVQSVLELDRVNVRQIMTPRPRIVWLEADDPPDLIWHKVVASHHSAFPLRESQGDHVIGLVTVKRLYAHLAADIPVNLRDISIPPLLVPETQTAIDLLETFKHNGKHIALATNEYGDISGLVTTNDLLEAIVGELPEPEKRPATFVRREDGSMLVDALVGIDEIEEYFSDFFVDEEDQRKFSTLGGYVCERLGHLPTEGEHFEDRGLRFEVVDMDRFRVDKVLVQKVEPKEMPGSGVPGDNDDEISQQSS